MAKIIGYRIKQMEFDDGNNKTVKLDRVSFFTLTQALGSTDEGGQIPCEYKVEIKDLPVVFGKPISEAEHPTLQAFLSKQLNRDCILEAVPDGKKMKLVRVVFYEDLMREQKGVK